MKIIEWNHGHLGYKKCTLEIDDTNKNGLFTTELQDVDTEYFNSLNDIILANLSKRGNRKAEVLYSGGIDSEVTLLTCVKNNIPVRAITGMYMYNGMILNTYDLYYAEKFCRNYGVEHKILKLDVGKFFESGSYSDYIWPYRIAQSHVAIHFWMIEKCDFPIMGGDYTWPWTVLPIVSPERMPYTRYECFMKDKNIDGIGDMLGHRLESNMLLIKTHNEIMSKYESMPNLGFFKNELYSKLGYPELEIRMRNYGFNNIEDVFNIHQYSDIGYKLLGIQSEIIRWDKKIASALDGEPGFNNRFS